MLQILITILAGILTIGAPCILPVLPILFGASVGQRSPSRPLFIALGFILAFSVLGLTLSALINSLHLAPDGLRKIAIVALLVFGFFMLFPALFEKIAGIFSSAINRAGQTANKAGPGNLGGFFLGVLLGIVWTPCAGPVLGAILALIATSRDMASAAILLFAYAVGAGLPMLAIAYGSQALTTKIKSVAKYSSRIQQIFGAAIILLAIAMYFQYDILLQSKILQYFPSLNPKF